jgi:predicted small lipoprotein YifL
MSHRLRAGAVLAGLLLSLVACGIKGPPRPPEPAPPPTPAVADGGTP